jgi:hypothetical protein
MKPEDLKPIEFRQLCALLKTILQSEPTIDDAEWKARAFDTLAKWGFHPPKGEQLGRAMSAVEHALKQTIGPRPVAMPEKPTPTPVQTAPPESRNHRPAGWDIVVSLMAKLRAGSSGSGPSSPAPEPRETLDVSEEDALNEFWRAANSDADRIALLRAFAELAIVRPSGWNVVEIRAEAHQHHLAASRCFACWIGGRVLSWHHVIQIQFGGSNYVRNRVAICEACHAAVHPWLNESEGRTVKGWTPLSGCTAAALEALRNRKKAAS